MKRRGFGLNAEGVYRAAFRSTGGPGLHVSATRAARKALAIM
jgi:hypothetical protein